MAEIYQLFPNRFAKEQNQLLEGLIKQHTKGVQIDENIMIEPELISGLEFDCIHSDSGFAYYNSKSHSSKSHVFIKSCSYQPVNGEFASLRIAVNPSQKYDLSKIVSVEPFNLPIDLRSHKYDRRRLRKVSTGGQMPIGDYLAVISGYIHGCNAESKDTTEIGEAIRDLMRYCRLGSHQKYFKVIDSIVERNNLNEHKMDTTFLLDLQEYSALVISSRPSAPLPRVMQFGEYLGYVADAATHPKYYWHGIDSLRELSPHEVGVPYKISGSDK